MKPLSDVESDEIQNKAKRKTGESNDDEIGSVRRKVLPSVSADKQRIARRKIEHAGKVRKVRGPIHPAGHESRELSESLLAPEIHAPLFRIP